MTRTATPRFAASPSVMPDWLIKALCALLVLLSVTGLVRPGNGNLLSANSLLELAYIVFPVAVVAFTPRFRVQGTALPLLLLLAGVLAMRWLIILMEGEAPIGEALRAHKWILFMALLALLMGVRVSGTRALVVTTKLVLVMAAAKYALSVFVFGSQRPSLFRENNYEIALFVGLFMVTYRDLGRRRALYLLALAAIVILSSSRSGIVALLIAVLYAMGVERVFRRPVLAYGAVVAAGGLGYFALSLFDSRSGGGQVIDRQKFLDAFISDTRTWEPLTWMFGTHPISEMSADSCNSLAYWSGHLGIDSDGGEGSCYSVVFHAFLIRVIFDFGILGLILAFGGVWFLLAKAGVARSLALALMAVAVANSASVSGLNNAYVMFPLALAVITAGVRADAPHPPGELARVRPRFHRR